MLCRESVSETIKPNQNAPREFDSLTKLLEARLTEIKEQEKHNEGQILVLEKERREVKVQKSDIDEQRRLLGNDKERMEQKIDQVRIIYGLLQYSTISSYVIILFSLKFHYYYLLSSFRMRLIQNFIL